MQPSFLLTQSGFTSLSKSDLIVVTHLDLGLVIYRWVIVFLLRLYIQGC
jgi:hypothetical protein